MNFIVKLLCVAVFLISCAAPRNVYKIPQYTKTPHAQEMEQFKTRKDVLMHFGAPDKNASMDSIEVIEYQLGQIVNTNSVSNSRTRGESGLSNNPLAVLYSGTFMLNENPYYNPATMNTANNIILTQYVTSSISNSSSETILKNAKFWLINGKVMKWETQGIDLGKTIINPNYSEEDKLHAERQSKSNATITNIFLVVILGTFTFVLLSAL
jgi:hypothetical protein